MLWSLICFPVNFPGGRRALHWSSPPPLGQRLPATRQSFPTFLLKEGEGGKGEEDGTKKEEKKEKEAGREEEPSEERLICLLRIAL